LGTARTHVAVTSLAQAATVAQRAVAAAGPDADGHLRVDLRSERVALTVQTRDRVSVTGTDLDLVGRITAGVLELGLLTEPAAVQGIELAIDALDIAAIRPFWLAVLGYRDEAPGEAPEPAPEAPIADPLRLGPTIWFQQMDEPRPQRNRIHFDVGVIHDEAPGRIAAALAAGGRLVYDKEAPAFWVLADAEGNEACVCTWQGRD
jgi:4a-hydroxytetrahydrobiopterin dehydratase